MFRPVPHPVSLLFALLIGNGAGSLAGGLAGDVYKRQHLIEAELLHMQDILRKIEVVPCKGAPHIIIAVSALGDNCLLYTSRCV